MNAERRNKILQRKNDQLKDEVAQLRQRLMEREDELDGEELREELLVALDELSEAVEGVRETQKEYDELIHEMIMERNEFKKEMYRLNPMLIFRKKNRK